MGSRWRLACEQTPWALMLAGTVLRLIWPADMEWKFDEKWMFATALRIATGIDAWPWIGMPSGVGLRNPGLSLWPFVVLARFSEDPVAMAQAIQALNVLALWGFALWVRTTWPRDDRELGLWGVALFAVSPLPILFARKIWAQDLLPLLLLPWLWSHSRRTSRAGAVAWGVCGALLGQLHMSGFFAAAGLFAATLNHDRRTFPWLPWLAGSAAGALPMLPWVGFVLSARAPAVSSGSWSLRFFSEAFANAWGLGLRYPLGHLHRELLAGPHVAGIATHAALLVRYALYALAALAVVLLFRDRKRMQLSAALRIYLYSIAIGGLLMSLARVHMYAHYLIAWSPLLHIAAAWTLYRQRWALALLCSAQLALSVMFFVFIHQRGGAPGVDYGTAYSHQTPEQRRIPE